MTLLGSSEQLGLELDVDRYPHQGASDQAIRPTRRPQLRDVDARRECPVCRAAAGQPCYQRCEAHRG